MRQRFMSRIVQLALVFNTMAFHQHYIFKNLKKFVSLSVKKWKYLVIVLDFVYALYETVYSILSAFLLKDFYCQSGSGTDSLNFTRKVDVLLRFR